MGKEVKDHLGNVYASESQMCAKYSISQGAFYSRYHVLKWALEDSLTIPVRQTTRKKKNQQTSFVVSGKYPSEEYLNYLMHTTTELEQNRDNTANSRIKNMCEIEIAKIVKIITKVSDESFWFHIMDMIYAEESELAKDLCDENTYKQCQKILRKPSGIEKEIYVDFANDYMKKQIQ